MGYNLFSIPSQTILSSCISDFSVEEGTEIESEVVFPSLFSVFIALEII